MRAFIKENMWDNFVIQHYIKYHFMCDRNPITKGLMYVRLVDDYLGVFVTSDREIHIGTPMGESPFLESHKDKYMDLLDDDLVEYVKGEFD